MKVLSKTPNYGTVVRELYVVLNDDFRWVTNCGSHTMPVILCKRAQFAAPKLAGIIA